MQCGEGGDLVGMGDDAMRIPDEGAVRMPWGIWSGCREGAVGRQLGESLGPAE